MLSAFSEVITQVFYRQVQELSVKVILFTYRQKSEDSVLFVKSAHLGHSYCENSNISQQHMKCGHRSFHLGSFDKAGGLGISTADGFQKTSPCIVNVHGAFDYITLAVLCGGGSRV